MKVRFFKIVLILCCFSANISSQSYNLDFDIQVEPSLQSQFKSNGRLFIFLNTNPNSEPRTLTWPSPGNFIFAKNVSNWQADQPMNITDARNWIKTADWSLEDVPEGKYIIQVLWDQDQEESRIDAPGNIYNKKISLDIQKDMKVSIILDAQIEPRVVEKHELVREISLLSDTLSTWWNKEIFVKASILLPKGYESGKAYPIRYNVAGYGGRYTRVNRLIGNSEFMDWWTGGEAPQVITVFLDGEGPYGDSYQMDSDNSGPYGHSLIYEVLPYIENRFRGTQDSKTRFVDGCSTGGWVSLGLQLYYPDHFNGVYSYSPDAIDFTNYQLINIYKDKNAYTNEFGYERPVARMTDGEPWIELRDFIQYENVLGVSDTYLNSGGQFSAHNALYSPKGPQGLPKPLFDPMTGVIDESVAKAWEKYDFKKYAEKNWATLGPKLQDKIYIWMGDMDNFYLNPATRSFDKFLKSTKSPTSNAEIVFTAMQGHCQQFSNRKVLEQITDRLLEIKE